MGAGSAVLVEDRAIRSCREPPKWRSGLTRRMTGAGHRSGRRSRSTGQESGGSRSRHGSGSRRGAGAGSGGRRGCGRRRALGGRGCGRWSRGRRHVAREPAAAGCPAAGLVPVPVPPVPAVSPCQAASRCGLGRRGGQCREPSLLALAVEGVHPGRFQRRGGVPQACQLVHQRAAAALWHRPRPGAGRRWRGRRRPCGSAAVAAASSAARLASAAASVRDCAAAAAFSADSKARARPAVTASQRGGILQGPPGAADKAAEGRVQPAVAVQVTGQLAELLAGLGLFCLGRGSPGGRHSRGVAACGQLHEGLAVRVVCLQGCGEAGFLGGRRVGQEAVDPGDLCRRRAFTGLCGGDLLR